MSAIVYLSVDEVIHLHEILIQRFGGSLGLRDAGLLSSAVHRPQSGYYETLYEQAASIFQSLALNHVFVDGNKRIAFAAADVFLRCNGISLDVQADDAETFIIKTLIKGKAELSEIAKWLEKNSKAIKK